jgi:hypothetical protein
MLDAKSKILQSGDFLPAGEIARVAGYSDKNPGEQLSRWQKGGSIVVNDFLMDLLLTSQTRSRFQ